MTVKAGENTTETTQQSRRPLWLVRSAPLAALGLLVGAFFWKLAFTNLILARGDTFLYFYPYWEAAGNALREGRVPLWNPALFMGAPFLANSQVGFFYPLNWPVWLFLETPYAVSASILLHLLIAGGGAYALGRRALGLSRVAAWLAAALFAVGGYLTAQVEHVNQLQGMAWLPWLLLAADWTFEQQSSRRKVRGALVVALIFGLQLLAGHTQSVFISGVGLLLWVLLRLPGVGWGDDGPKWLQVASRIWPYALGAVAALALAAVQLLPTLDLVGQSSRQGGLPLNEALSFSLHPLLLGQALLPHVGQSLFTEYVAFLPLTALILAVIGAWRWRRQPRLKAPLGLAVGGFLLGLGRFNPLYIALAHLPGFNLFRAPARWLLLYVLGMALLAGVGWDLARAALRDDSAAAESRRVVRNGLVVGVLLLLALVAWHFLAVPLGSYLPVGAEAPLEPPSGGSLLLWVVELGLAGLLLALPRRLGRGGLAPLWTFLSATVLLTSLFVASRALPYNTPTAPAAYFDLRSPQARLLARGNCDLLPQTCQEPQGRLLSLSDIFFDLGDQAELATVYGDQLSEQALYDLLIATKQKEIIAPNLPLASGLASVDGFDGGILPLRDYVRLVQLLLPPDVQALDGRLREYLDGVPQDRWLDLFNARYVITDKVGDVWRRDVFFDMTHPVAVTPGDGVAVGHVPEYEATALWLVADGPPGTVALQTTDGTRWEVTPQQLEDDLWRAEFPDPAVLQSVELLASLGTWRVQGLALVDSRDDSFHSLVAGNYRLLHSGDVKIYENLDVLPRAFLVHRWQWQPDLDSSISAMTDPAFDPTREAILTGQGPPPDEAMAEERGRARIVQYDAERVVIETTSSQAGLLLLTDAAYPGWQATLDGESIEIYQADGLFRGVLVPSGTHRVTFTFNSRSFALGRIVTLLTVAILIAALAVLTVRRRRRRDQV